METSIGYIYLLRWFNRVNYFAAPLIFTALVIMAFAMPYHY
jgi:hypothetical protein